MKSLLDCNIKKRYLLGWELISGGGGGIFPGGGGMSKILAFERGFPPISLVRNTQDIDLNT